MSGFAIALKPDSVGKKDLVITFSGRNIMPSEFQRNLFYHSQVW
jgi:hypothetical protein